jgi:DNA recombination protein RmuC
VEEIVIGSALIVWVVAAAVVLLVVMAAMLLRRVQGEAQQVGDLRRDVADLAGKTQNFTEQLGQMSRTVNEQIGQVHGAVQKGLADSGGLATAAQTAVSTELRNSQEVLAQLRGKIGEIQAMGEQLSVTSKTLENVLAGPKTRGMLGEAALERILEDGLPRQMWERQYRFADGSIVDAVVKIGEHWLCIDSKFPLESYLELLEVGEDARSRFGHVVRRHADAIAEKYILPAQHTLDYALMFVPSESIYYELLQTEAAKGQTLEKYCRVIRVIPVSPNLCYAYVSAVATALRGMKLADNLRELQGQIDGLDHEFADFRNAFEKLGKHLQNAHNMFVETDDEAHGLGKAIEQMRRAASAASSNVGQEEGSGRLLDGGHLPE